MYLSMRVKVGGMTDHPIVVGVALVADHRQAQGEGFVVGRGCSITFDRWHGSMKPEERRTIMGGHVAPFSRMCSSLHSKNHWVPQQRPNDQRRCDDWRHKPIGKVRKVLPDQQLFSVVHVESDQHDDVGQAHS